MQLEFEIPLLVVLIGLSGFFSGLEVALVGVRISKIEQMVKDRVKGASSLLKLKTNPSRMMASVNLGNNLVNVAATAIATDIAFEIREKGRSKRKPNPKSPILLDGEIIRDKKGAPIKKNGLFKDVKAVGWYVDEFKCAQISINFNARYILDVLGIIKSGKVKFHFSDKTAPTIIESDSFKNNVFLIMQMRA